MEQIVTIPLYIRCKKVIESCQTIEQLETATKYYILAYKKTRGKLYPTLGNLNECTARVKLWHQLLNILSSNRERIYGI